MNIRRTGYVTPKTKLEGKGKHLLKIVIESWNRRVKNASKGKTTILLLPLGQGNRPGEQPRQRLAMLAARGESAALSG